MKSVLGSVLFIATLLAANVLHAQLSGENLSAIETGALLPANEMPISGTFYSAANPGLPPIPSNFFGDSGWNAGGGIYLLDDLPGASNGRSFALDDSGGFFPGGDGGSGSNIFNGSFTFSTNGLWLSITNVADSTVYANLNNGTDFVYQIFSLTNLSMATAVSNWNTETEVFPGINTNVMPFTVSMNGRNPLFLWARDWTGITTDGNQTPSWWFWEYYGTTDLSDTNLDSQGNTLLYDYQHSINPNPAIGFSAQFPNNVQSNAFDATVTIYSGEPFYEAVLVNDTNAADAVWQPYSGTNIAVSLNSSNGIYTVSVGLRGFPSNATATWVTAQVTLENLVPVLTVTSPASGIVSQPVIQVQGLVSETLSNLTYDVSNALGVVSNQQGYWSPSYFDTNVDDFTTNTFQCYDVQLAGGMNTITLHATDAQGNTATASVNYTLDYSDATPPALSILWPPNGAAISGSNFTLQAQVDDDTATVTAQVVDTNGDTNTVQGLVERSGLVLANNLPLAAGTNILTVTATDAAGLSVTNNLTVVQSSALVTVDPLNQPNQATVSVTGTISDPTCTLTVNGTNAYYLDDEGDWEADNVSVSPTGTATLDVEVYSGDPLNIGSLILAVAQPSVVAMMSYAKNTYSSSQAYNYCTEGTVIGSGTETVNWLYSSGGSDAQSSSANLDGDCQPASGSSSTVAIAGGYNGYSPTWEISSSQSSYYDFFYYFKNTPVYQVGSDSYAANTKAMVMPTDQAGLGQTALYLVGAQVFDEDTGNQLPASALQFESQVPGTLAIDVTNSGSVWTVFLAKGPAGTNLEVTPQAAGRNISFNPPWQAMTFQLTVVSNSAVQINGTTNWATVESPTNYVIVQMDVNSANTPLLPWIETNITWSGGTPVPGNPLQCEVSTAVSTNVTVTASVGPYTNSLDVWVIWATVNILTTGTNPLNAPQFGSVEDGTENLGIQYFNNSNSVAGKICAVATVTPAGVHSVITNGWGFTQMKWTKTFVDGAIYQPWSFSPWTGDGPNNGFYTTSLDANEKLYTIDGPSILAGGFGATNSLVMYKNFYDYITWNSQMCSDTNAFWHFQGQWTNQSPQFNSLSVGTGTITIP